MPYVQSKPELAVTAHGKPSPMLREVARNLPAWAQRPLLFFVGHVPKVTISATRWNIWAAVHNEKDVTTRSHSVHCTVGQFAICEDPKRLQNVTVSGEFQTYCHEMCKTPSDPRIRYTDGRVLPAPCRGRNGNGLPGAVLETRGGAVSAGAVAQHTPQRGRCCTAHVHVHVREFLSVDLYRLAVRGRV